ncbi:uncharacterized protein AB9X84_006896 [Acanthopagrus schlegelii]
MQRLLSFCWTAMRMANEPAQFPLDRSAALRLRSGFAPPSGSPHWLRFESATAQYGRQLASRHVSKNHGEPSDAGIDCIIVSFSAMTGPTSPLFVQLHVCSPAVSPDEPGPQHFNTHSVISASARNQIGSPLKPRYKFS